MKTITKSLLALVAVFSLSMFLAGCQSKFADYQGYSAPGAGSAATSDNVKASSGGYTDPTRGAGYSDNDANNAGVSGPTNEARGTQSMEN